MTLDDRPTPEELDSAAADRPRTLQRGRQLRRRRLATQAGVSAAVVVAAVAIPLSLIAPGGHSQRVIAG